MQDILTITLNPAVDLSTATNEVEPGPKLRCDPPRSDPGGGGVNVSRTIRILDGQSRALIAVGGPTGEKLRHLLMAEGIGFLPFRAPGETRQSLAVTDRGTGQQYRFVLPGPEWDAERSGAMLDMIADAVAGGSFVVVSGSNPPGLPGDFLARVAIRLAGHGAKLVVDTSGDALRRLTRSPGAFPPLYVLRMDQEEAEALAGRALPARSDSADFAARLVAQGIAQAVIVARGADGSVLAAQGLRLHVTPPPGLPVRSKVGAGDSFVGAFTLALARGADLGEALRWGAAAAAATVMTEATLLCTREDTERLLADCTLSAV
jgi:6-phosphofructokinase 2